LHLLLDDINWDPNKTTKSFSQKPSREVNEWGRESWNELKLFL